VRIYDENRGEAKAKTRRDRCRVKAAHHRVPGATGRRWWWRTQFSPATVRFASPAAAVFGRLRGGDLGG
jgi:hypothetical protein